MSTSVKKDADDKVYLIVPSAGAEGSKMMVDKSILDQGLGDKMKQFFGWRKEIEADSSAVKQQINNYVTIIRGVAERDKKEESVIQLSEITLSLTLSAEGNIGIASTSAEAGITLVFKRG